MRLVWEAAGPFAFYRHVFTTGEPGHLELNYQHDGLDNYFRIAARRCGELLVVSFTDTADQDRSAVEMALRASQGRERAARAEAEARRAALQRIYEQAPVAIAICRGATLVVEVANPLVLALWGRSAAECLGRPLFEALPELNGQGFELLFEGVLRTGTPIIAQEYPAILRRRNQLETAYFNFIYDPLRDEKGDINGVIIIATEVTAQVLARRQVQALNAELEARVAARTHDAQMAHAEAERQRTRLERLFQQAPAAICILGGPELVYELVNPAYQQLFPGRRLLGRPLLDALPEIAGHAVHHTFRRVYETGITHWELSILIPLARPKDGVLEDRYFNYTQQARHDEVGRIDGVLVFALEVTQQVLAHQQANALQAQVLAATQSQAQEREMFYRIFEETPAAVALLRGPEHRYQYCNPANDALFPGRHLLGHTVQEALPETVEQGIVALLDQVYQTGETYFGSELPFAITLPDGRRQESYFNLTFQAFRESGEVAGISLFAYDVTEQVHIRQQRDAQQRQLTEVFGQAPVAVAVFRGPDYVVEVANPSVAALWGRTVEQVLHQPLFETLPEMRDQGFKEVLDQVVRTGEAFVAQEQLVLLARGEALEKVYVNFVYQPLRDEYGRISSVAAVATEVTVQVLARQQAERSEQQFRTLLESIPQMTWTNTPDGEMTFYNERWYAYTGLTFEETTAWGWQAVVHPHDLAETLRCYLDALATGTVFSMENRYRRGLDGAYRWHLSQAVPLRDAAGRITAWVGTATDIDQQKLLEHTLLSLTQQLHQASDEAQELNADLQTANQALKATNQRLTYANADLDTFIYTASHDLKGPIINLEGLLQALREELPAPLGQAESVAPLLKMMQGAVDRFLLTIAQLTDIAKLQQAYEQPAEPVDMAALVEAICLDLAPALQAAAARLDVDVTACPTVSFAPKNLRSIVYNLLSNAVKYQHPARPPVVRLRSTCRPGFAILEVQDNGLGLDAAQQAKLFGLYRRLHSHVEGSGIGLYMVKRMVGNAGGAITVQSEAGIGSTFTVTLPTLV